MIRIKKPRSENGNFEFKVDLFETKLKKQIEFENIINKYKEKGEISTDYIFQSSEEY